MIDRLFAVCVKGSLNVIIHLTACVCVCAGQPVSVCDGTCRQWISPAVSLHPSQYAAYLRVHQTDGLEGAGLWGLQHSSEHTLYQI